MVLCNDIELRNIIDNRKSGAINNFVEREFKKFMEI